MSRDTSERDAPLPSGTLTFLFTDIEGSTGRWERDRRAMAEAVACHDALVRDAIVRRDGHVFKTVGDAFCAAFARADDAAGAALDAQRAIAAHDFSTVDGLRVRMALHTGTASERDGDYFGPHVNRVARLLSLGHGGQVLISGTTAELLRDDLSEDVSLHALGPHPLRDIALPEHVSQLTAADLRAEFPALRAVLEQPTNLPASARRLVGRSADVAAIVDLLTASRVVTILGSGGVGKTQAALGVGAELLGRYADGVWIVELAPLADAGLIPVAIASALHVQLAANLEPVAALAGAMRRLHALVILDNCEHLIGPAAAIAAAIVHACPGVVLLATSRQQLGIAAEKTYRLPSLAVPDEAVSRAAAALAFPAVELFAARAVAVNARFQLTDENASAVAEICRRLDGIPLALELAAARVGVLAVDQIRGRLDERFRILTGGSRDALPRQQTMRAMIDWSYELLSVAERALLRRVAIFANGWTLEAAEAVCSDALVDESAILELQSSLVEKSLVVADVGGNEARYRLLESTRLYGLEKLAACGERDVLANRHLAWAAAFADREGARSWDIPLARWLPPVQAELDNLRAALEWSLRGGGDVPTGAAMVGALLGLWFHSTSGAEGRALAQAALSALGDEAPRLLVARLHLTVALLAAGKAGVAAAERAVELYTPIDEPFDLALSYRQLAVSYVQTGQPREALAQIDRALAIYVDLKLTDRWPYGAALVWRATILTALERHDEARRLFAEAIAFMDRRGDARRASFPRLKFAQLEAIDGNVRGALTLACEAAATFAEAHEEGREAIARSDAAAYELLLGDVESAATQALRALRLARRSQASPQIATAIQHSATVAALRGDAGPAARLRGYVEAWMRAEAHAREASEQRTADLLLHALQNAMTAEEIAACARAGATWTEDQAIAEAQSLLLAGRQGQLVRENATP